MLINTDRRLPQMFVRTKIDKYYSTGVQEEK